MKQLSTGFRLPRPTRAMASATSCALIIVGLTKRTRSPSTVESARRAFKAAS